MRFICFGILILSSFCTTSAQHKAFYDIDPQALMEIQSAQGHAALGKRGSGAHMMNNAVSSATLLNGGYFTVGTTGGASTSILDDNCQVTYGHPYALTSFVSLFWEGKWRRADEFFPSAGRLIRASPDTLTLEMRKEAICTLLMHVIQDAADGSIDIAVQLTNHDAFSRRAGLAIQFDPALGRWGDAAIWSQETLISRDTVLTGGVLKEGLHLRERAAAEHFGLAVGLHFHDPSPATLDIHNWTAENAPAAGRHQLLYDALFNAQWEVTELPPGASATARLAVDFIDPDFGSILFTRTSIPAALVLDDGLLFPSTFRCEAEMYNDGDRKLSGTVDISTGARCLEVENASIDFTAEKAGCGYAGFVMHVGENYDERIVPVTMFVSLETEIVDSLTRYIHIPPIPVSDTGLVVTIDSIGTGQHPAVDLYVDVLNEQGQYPITALQPHHVRLFENGGRIEDFACGRDDRNNVDAVDLVFVLDVTGSMANEISAVRDNITAFASDLENRGINYRLGMVTFRDEVAEQYPFTDDVAQFREYVAAQQAIGGGDGPENSLDALYDAADYPFRNTAQRIAIWITDNKYHERDYVTSLHRSEVLALLLMNAVTVHCIGATAYKSCYDPLLEPTGGQFFSINGNFLDIMLQIAQFNGSTTYKIRYVTPNPSAASREITVQVHYAGKGGSATVVLEAPPQLGEAPRVQCFPNPFNPVVNISVQRLSGCVGSLRVFDPTGRELRRYMLDGTHPSRQLQWDAGAPTYRARASGVYLLRLELQEPDGSFHQETVKVMYAK